MTTFTRIKFIETDEEEIARLAAAPQGSDAHRLSSLPILNQAADQDHLYELPWGQLHPCTSQTGNRKHECSGTHRVAGIPVKFHPGPSADLPLDQRRHDGYWDFRILASDHPSYPVGGYQIVVTESELRRSPIIEL